MSTLRDQFARGLAEYMYDNPDEQGRAAALHYTELKGLRRATWETLSPAQQNRAIRQATNLIPEVGVKRLADALAPFAKFAETYLANLEGSTDRELRGTEIVQRINNVDLTLGDLRHAVAAYNKEAREVVR